MHNQAVMKEVAYETAIYGTMLDKVNSKEMKGKMWNKYENSIEGRLISMKKPDGSIKVEGNTITVKVRGTMDTVPIGFLPSFNGYEIIAEKSVTFNNPLDKIRILKMIKNAR